MALQIDKDRLIQVLKSQGTSSHQIEQAEALSQKKRMGFSEALVDLEFMNEKQVAGFTAEALRIPFVDVKELALGSGQAHILPEKLARRYTAIAFGMDAEGLTLVLADPSNMDAIEDVRIFTERQITPALGVEKDILQAIDQLYGKKDNEKEDANEFDGTGEKDHSSINPSDFLILDEDESDAPIVKVVDLILTDSLDKGASDIHIEPFEDRVRVRYRIDGNLVDAISIPKKQQDALLARLKILANLDITENRIPQDGRFKVKKGDKEVDYRVSILPVFWGGKVVFRALDKSNLQTDLGALGFGKLSLNHFKEALKKPFGMIIVTGPTGSGKSTTLYSILSELNSVERNIMTVEDPIEYQVGGLTQVPVRPEIGMTFANALRAILRQSPDVVMIGEIRDSETADIAVKASLTGQTVLSTLHTNDAPGAVARLRDMGVEPFLISSSLVLVAAQRLCRKICTYCKQPVKVSEDQLAALNFEETVGHLIKKPQFSKGKGCARCGKSGYSGRISITETMLIDPEIQQLIDKEASPEELKTCAVKNGMMTLRMDALLKFAEGLITLDEVIRVTSGD